MDNNSTITFKLDEQRPDWYPLPDGETFQKMADELALFFQFKPQVRQSALLFLIAIEHKLVEKKELTFELPIDERIAWDMISSFINTNQPKVKKWYHAYLGDVAKYLQDTRHFPEILNCINLVLKDMFQIEPEEMTPEELSQWEHDSMVESGLLDS